MKGYDHTAFDIEVDPTKRIMSGVSIHGLVSFSVPFMTEIAPNLWQGGCQNGLVLPEFIEHLVSLYPWEKYHVKHDLQTSLSVKMFDSLDQATEQIDDIARWVNSCRKTGPVLVHCQAGLNRSSLVAARALVLEGMGSSDAVALIRKNRSPACLCNPEFERWLLS